MVQSELVPRTNHGNNIYYKYSELKQIETSKELILKGRPNWMYKDMHEKNQKTESDRELDPIYKNRSGQPSIRDRFLKTNSNERHIIDQYDDVYMPRYAHKNEELHIKGIHAAVEAKFGHQDYEDRIGQIPSISEGWQ
jgi:hypothetical protein